MRGSGEPGGTRAYGVVWLPGDHLYTWGVDLRPPWELNLNSLVLLKLNPRNASIVIFFGDLRIVKT